MVLPLCVLLSVLVGLCWFGSFKNLLAIKIRLLWLPAAAALAEFSALPLYRLFGEGFRGFAFAPTVISYGLLFAFLIANLRLRGTPLMALGGAANLAVIAANGFLMPVAAVPPAGMTEFQSLRYVPVSGETRLLFLADVIRLPLPYIGGYASAGDIFLALGAAVFILGLMRPAGGYFSGIRKL